MNLIDRLREMLAPNAALKVTEIEAAIADLQGNLERAQAEAVKAQQDFSADVLTRLTKGDPTEDEAARRRVHQAELKAQELAAALQAARKRLEQAKLAASTALMEESWRKTKTTLEQRAKAAQRLQDLADQFADAHRDFLDLTEAAWQAAPHKLNFRPPTFSAPDINARLQLYMYGTSDGRLGKGTNSWVARNRPGFATVALESGEMLMQGRDVQALTVEV